MIHWNALALVAVTTLIGAVVVVAVVATGILALSRAGDVESAGGARATMLRGAGYLCLALAAAVVLFGIYLIVPAFH